MVQFDLTPAPGDGMGVHPTERRLADRLLLDPELRAEVRVPQSIAVGEISSAGFHVETPFPLQLNALYEFRLALRERAVVAKGRITHCSIVSVDPGDARYRSGVQFADLPEPVAQELAAFVEAVRRSSRQTLQT